MRAMMMVAMLLSRRGEARLLRLEAMVMRMVYLWEKMEVLLLWRCIP